MKQDSDKTIGCILAAATFLLIIPSIIWRGYVLSILWGWFIAPKFGLPVLAVAEAIAMALVVGFLTKQYQDVAKEDKPATEKMGEAIASMILQPAMALLMGWAIKFFLP